MKPQITRYPLVLSISTCYVFLVLILSAQCFGQEPTGNLVYRQIVSRQYSLENSVVPEEVHSILSRPASKEVKARDGIRWKAGAQGLVETDPSGKTKIWTPKDGLPILPLTSIAAGPEGWIWLGTPNGAICFRPNAPAGERWSYFWGRRYLDDNDVVGLMAQPHRAWIRTRTGVSLIEFKRFTLEQKSTLIENRLHECPDRYGLVADSQLLRPGDPTSCRPDPPSNDNDGLSTSLYMAAECFRFDATHSPEALRNAHHSLNALERLLSITGIPGFPARSFASRSAGGDTGGEWHWTADHAWRWKGDTSNDELVGHYFAYSVAYDLLPSSDVAARKAIRQAVQSITDGLVRHGFRLVGYGNRVTRWGDYSPQYFATPEGEAEAGTALELLSLLRTAYHITGDPKFLDAYRQIVEKYGYVQHVIRGVSMLPPINSSDYYSDEKLAFLSIYPLLKYEDNPVLVRQYRQILTLLWRRAESEHNPLWDYIYAVGTGAKNYGAQEALETLERIPLDMTWWTVHNSQRLDLFVAADPNPDRAKQAERVIPPDQRCMTKTGAESPFQMDCDIGGRGEGDGTIFLLPYWMGRYYRLLPP